LVRGFLQTLWFSEPPKREEEAMKLITAETAMPVASISKVG
jgi:hypothetical protein